MHRMQEYWMKTWLDRLPSQREKSKEFRYLALHLRFEIDMVAHSLCDFGGGEEEKKELQAYREIHFPGLVELNNTSK
ncbi:GDP-fucose protein O-fucosyltransferase [Tanacetum coccineum]|uniref:O-fucosyltransferase family protein n=1 Tax=Tanacetum coccineum TaxID=301880 RepID=A0ABQ5F037_9ASTR